MQTVSARIAPAEQALRIPSRYIGFEGIVNGGYLAGLLQRALERPATITLFRPTPPERALRLIHEPGAIELRDDEQPLARAVPYEGDFAAPVPVPFEQAVNARHAYLGATRNPAPHCFVCGTREPGNGLRLRAGEIGTGRVAASWVPERWVAGNDDEADARFVGAALDCPSAWAVAALGEMHHVPMLLGTMHLRLLAPVFIGRPHVVVAEGDGRAGRKCFARSAVYDAAGRLCATAQSIWLRLEPTAN